MTRRVLIPAVPVLVSWLRRRQDESILVDVSSTSTSLPTTCGMSVFLSEHNNGRPVVVSDFGVRLRDGPARLSSGSIVYSQLPREYVWAVQSFDRVVRDRLQAGDPPAAVNVNIGEWNRAFRFHGAMVLRERMNVGCIILNSVGGPTNA